MLTTEERQRLEQVEGIVFDIQRYSLHDGPGLRTNVFLKGCPLRCAWCANPESQRTQPELMLSAHNCIECGHFAESCLACSAGRQHASAELELAARVDICPTGALHWVGERRTAGEVLREVLRDAPFYGNSGGMTLTGGEPTMQPAMAEALLRLAKDAGITTAMETCGQTQWSVYARLLPFLDLVLFDVKHVDSAIHRVFTGMGNELILENLHRLAQTGTPVIVRVPLIPGFNASAPSVQAIAELVSGLGPFVQAIHLLPYHTLGRAKYKALGIDYPWEDHARLTDDEVAELAAVVADHNLVVRIGG